MKITLIIRRRKIMLQKISVYNCPFYLIRKLISHIINLYISNGIFAERCNLSFYTEGLESLIYNEEHLPVTPYFETYGLFKSKDRPAFILIRICLAVQVAVQREMSKLSSPQIQELHVSSSHSRNSSVYFCSELLNSYDLV